MHKEYTVNRNNNKKLESMSMDNTYNNQNLPTIPHNHENSINFNHNKLYNCHDNIQKKRRVRSVVRISRRSSEPQVMGSKPTGPV